MPNLRAKALIFSVSLVVMITSSPQNQAVVDVVDATELLVTSIAVVAVKVRNWWLTTKTSQLFELTNFSLLKVNVKYLCQTLATFR